MPTREEVIDYGYKNKISPEGTNSVLKKYNYPIMGPVEEGLYVSRNKDKNLVERVMKNALDFGAGINTFMTLGADKVPDLIKNPVGTTSDVLNKAGNYLANRGIYGAIKDAGSLLGSPYGITEENIKNRGLGTVLKNAPGYAWANPGYAMVDIALPFMGRLPKHQVGDFLERVKAPESVRQFVPSTNISKVNEAINTSRGQISSINNAMRRELASATNLDKVNMGQVARNLEAPTRGQWVGNAETLKATEKMRDIAKKYGERLIAQGALPEMARLNAQTQYILENVNPKRANNIVAKDIADKIMNNSVKIPGVKTEQFNKLLAEANNLYDQGIISPLSHRATYKFNPERKGLVTKEDKALGALANKEYGWATPEELRPTLFKAYEDVARDLYNAEVGRLSVKNIVDSIGERTTAERLKDARPLLDSEVLISPRAFEAKINSDFSKGHFSNTNNRLMELVNKGTPEAVKGPYKDDLWIVKRSDLKPLYNMASVKRSSDPFARLVRGTNSTWKTAQLITPKYVIENRLGNWGLNLTEGVTPMDYLDAIGIKNGDKFLYKGKYHDIMPERLKSDTSYYGVLGEEFRGTKFKEALTQSLKTIKQGFKDKSPKGIYRGVFDFFSAPTLAVESQLESVDRYANFIRQAKRMAKETGEDVDYIIRKASKDNKLYSKLMGNVNRSLGDYIGRNWAIDPGVYEAMSMAFPFFKYPTQAVRTLTHQAMSKTGGFATVVSLPQRIGNKVWQEQVAKYPELEGYEGGIVDHKEPGRYGALHIHQSDVHPLGAGAGLIASGLSDWRNINLSPLFSLSRIPYFLDRYGNTASSPKYYNSGKYTFVRDPRTGRPTRELATPGIGDRLAYAGSWYGNTFVPPVIAWNRAYGPLTASAMAGLTKKDATWYPNYDTSVLGQIGEGKIPSWLQPIISGKTDRPGKKFPDTGLNQLGVRTISVYPKQQASAKDYKNAIKKYESNKRRKKYKEE